MSLKYRSYIRISILIHILLITNDSISILSTETIKYRKKYKNASNIRRVQRKLIALVEPFDVFFKHSTPRYSAKGGPQKVGVQGLLVALVTQTYHNDNKRIFLI